MFVGMQRGWALRALFSVRISPNKRARCERRCMLQVRAPARAFVYRGFFAAGDVGHHLRDAAG
eukprot:8824572-Lingulodinium_polyedra.AAC.1